MLQSRSKTYVNAQVTDRELILNAKSVAGLSTFEQRILIEKIDSVSMGKEMGAANKIFAIVGLASCVASFVLFSVMLAVAVPSLLIGIVVVVLALVLRPVSLSVGCGGRIEQISFKHFNGTKSKEIYSQLIAVLANTARRQPPVVGVRGSVNQSQGNGEQ